MEKMELIIGNESIKLERHEKGTTINPLYVTSEEITDEMILKKVGQLKDMFDLHGIPDTNKAFLNEKLLEAVCFSSYIELDNSRRTLILNQLN